MGTPPVPPQLHAKFTKAKSQTLLTDATDVVWHKTVIHMYAVSDSKLEELTSGFNSLYLLGCGIFLGAGVSLFIALRTTTSESDKPYYLAAVIACLGLGIWFGITGIYKYWKASQAKEKLYTESVPIEPLK